MKIVPIELAAKRRKYIELANADESWIAVKASFAIEGIQLDEKDAEMAGRFLAGDVNFEQALTAIEKSLNLTKQS